jgi:hypothetical protein
VSKSKPSKKEAAKKDELEATRGVIREERRGGEDTEEEDQYQEDWNSDESD